MQKILLISLLLLSKLVFNLIIFICQDKNRSQIGTISIFEHPNIELSGLNVNALDQDFRVISKGDILISEVLFNPKNGGVDFVEIYNHSGHDIDLSELQLANLNASGNPASMKKLSTSRLMMMPGTYWVVSSNSELIKLNYQTKFPNQLIQLSSLPAFNNDKGNVVLWCNGQVIDQLSYQSKIHHPLIQDEDGISIERVSFEVEANVPGNFKSAAANVGFATPTYANSQMILSADDWVRLGSKTFSPDGDGYEDLLMIDYQVKTNGCIANVNIYSDQGKLVRKLCRNQTIATTGSFAWDGLSDSGNLSPVGIYVVVFDYFDLAGNVKKIKNTFVLARKL